MLGPGQRTPAGIPSRRERAMLHLRSLGVMVVGLSLILGGAAIHDAVTAGATPAPTPAWVAGPYGPAPTSTAPPSPVATVEKTSPPPRTVPTLPPSDERHPVSGFLHPGVLVTRSQLDLVRARLGHGSQPWTSAFERLTRSPLASLEYKPHPREVVECGYFSVPDHGCRHEQRDALAAYTHALLWYLNLDNAHAQKAIEIINAWSRTVRSHTGANAPLQAGWSAATMVRAAEIMRHTYAGWRAETRDRAAAMFRDVYLPLVRDGAPRGSEGNWDLTMLDAAIGIAVFLDDRPLFDHAIAQWRARMPAYIYLASDGGRPVGPPKGVANLTAYWHGQTSYVDGLVQETCRDLSHTGWGLEAAAQIAETAWIQGVDLYTEAQPRLVAALELHAGLASGDPVPEWLCGGSLDATFRPIPEVAYNHYHSRLGIDMPRTAQYIESGRPQPASHFYAWATLTSVAIP